MDARRQAPTATLRASDADREKTIAFLRDHYVAGRLTLEELAERARLAYDARTIPELNGVLSDLPETWVPPPPVREVQVQAVGRIAERERTAAGEVMGGTALHLTSIGALLFAAWCAGRGEGVVAAAVTVQLAVTWLYLWAFVLVERHGPAIARRFTAARAALRSG